MLIRKRIGYCPQFDALLELLTVREHLELFGRIKGLSSPQVLKVVVDEKIKQLDLKDFEHKLAGSLSGGNKRKLSLGIALIGDPKILFLDEPSTVIMESYKINIVRSQANILYANFNLYFPGDGSCSETLYVGCYLKSELSRCTLLGNFDHAQYGRS